jgi:hypothetical protein
MDADPKDLPQLTRKERKDLKVLALFTALYCRERHRGEKRPFSEDHSATWPWQGKPLRLCDECREFLLYALQRRIKCPLHPKPTCKHCHIHCYRPGHREKVRGIMRFSGKRLIRRGRLDLLWHYFF